MRATPQVKRSDHDWILAAIVMLLGVVGRLVGRQRRSSQHWDGSGHKPHRSLASPGKKHGSAQLVPPQRPGGGERTNFPDLSPAARERYLERWTTAQRRFVDQPAVAIGEADRLVNEVMRDSGYLGEEHFGQPVGGGP